MTEKDQDNFLPLRTKAESLLEERVNASENLQPREYQQLLHDLLVHQVELELQNEELRQTQNALEQNRARYLNLYHQAPVGYVVLNRVGIIKETNATFAKMAGTDSPRLHGQPFADFLADDDQGIFRARLRSFFKNPAEKHITLRLKSTDSPGIYIDLSASSQQRLDAAEETQDELFVVVTDITSRVQAELSLQRSQQFVMAILDSLTAHVCVLDEHGTILAVNAAWRNFAAKNPPIVGNVAEGANYLDICDTATGAEQETARLFAAGIRRVLDNEQDMFSLEYPCHSTDQQRWFVGRVTNLVGDQPAAAIVVAHENVTDRKLLEQEQFALYDRLKQLAKAESLNLMAGSIAHNFNNMLGIIIGNLELTQDIVEEGGDATKPIKDALEGASRAAKVSGSMLTYLGQTRGEKKSMDLSLVCSQVCPMLQLAKPENCLLVADLPLPGPMIRANDQVIRQLLSSLVANGWEALGNQPGTVAVVITNVHPREIAGKNRFPLDWQPGNRGYACLSIRDTGCGIPADQVDKIFDPFFTSKFVGRGMGLAAVLGILRAHEGAVAVDSLPGSGTTIRAYFPLADSGDVLPR